MLRKIDLLIGDCRTGTTALQAAIVTGGLRDGLYPGRGLNHNEFARAVNDGVQQKAREVFETYLNEASEKGTERLVLSAEHLEFCDPQVVADLLSPVAEIQVYSVIRPHGSALLSRYCEHIKLGDALGPLRKFSDRMIERRRLLYAERLARWKSVFGGALNVSIYSEAALQDLLITLGGNGVIPRKNESLFLEELAFLRWTHLRLKALGIKRGDRGRFGRILTQSLSQRSGREGTPVYLPLGIADLIQAEFSEDAAQLDQEWFGGETFSSALKSDRKSAVDRPLQLQAELYYSSSVLAEADRAAQAFAELPYSATRDDILEVMFLPNTR